MDFNRIAKNVLPAAVVLVAGLFGINFIYNTYMSDGSNTVITLEPAAGEDAAAMTAEGVAVDAPSDATVAPTADVVVPPVAPVDCSAADAAATAAMGTPDAEATAKAAAECHATAAAATSATPAMEVAPAVEVAPEAAPAEPAKAE